MIRSPACFLLFAALSCAGAPRVAQPAADPSAVAPLAPSALFPFDDLSRAAFDLLSESAADSCSICARKAREEAFRILDETIRPGMIVAPPPDCPFLPAAEGESELILSCFDHEGFTLTFRFHTAADRLVGIAAADLTADSLAARSAAAVRIVPLAYGDGAAFLYHPAQNRLEVQSRPLPRAAARAKPPLAPDASGGL